MSLVLLGGIVMLVAAGVWSRGRHVRGDGFLVDCEKYNLAASDGWRVFRVGTGMDMVRFVTMLERVMGSERC